MLVLSRRVRQTIVICDPNTPGGIIEVTILGVSDDQVRLGVNAPRDTVIRRGTALGSEEITASDGGEDQSPPHSTR